MNEITFQEFALRLLLAVVCGGAVGLEREKHGRAAGFRTNILVCMGATLVMMCSQQIYALFQSLNGTVSVARVDPGRIASGIIMGIGFLGLMLGQAGLGIAYNAHRGLERTASMNLGRSRLGNILYILGISENDVRAAT